MRRVHAARSLFEFKVAEMSPGSVLAQLRERRYSLAKIMASDSKLMIEDGQAA